VRQPLIETFGVDYCDWDVLVDDLMQ